MFLRKIKYLSLHVEKIFDCSFYEKQFNNLYVTLYFAKLSSIYLKTKSEKKKVEQAIQSRKRRATLSLIPRNKQLTAVISLLKDGFY